MSFDLMLQRNLKETLWVFGEPDKQPYGTSMRLMSDGAIAGYWHLNERYWKLQDQRLIILNDQKVPTAVFDRISLDENQHIIIIGTFLNHPGSVVRLMELTETYLLQNSVSNFLPVDRSYPLNVRRASGIGDVLMLTAALREYKKQNPEQTINLYTWYKDLVAGLDFIDFVFDPDDAPENTIDIVYEREMPPLLHISKIMGYQLGIKVENVIPDCAIDRKIVQEWKEFFCTIPGPHFVVLRRASRYTPNKDWPESYWNFLINKLSQIGAVIEVGETRPDGYAYLNKNHWDFCGNTTVTQLVGLIAAADVFIGPVSGPLHIAAATGTPSVVIIGGYEHPKHTQYPGNIEVYRDIPCAPCWLRTPCPIDRECLKTISAQSVLEAVISILNRNKSTGAGSLSNGNVALFRSVREDNVISNFANLNSSDKNVLPASTVDYTAAHVRTPNEDSGNCKICGDRSSLCGEVDFERSCGDFHSGRIPRISGLPIFYRRCDNCGFLFTNAFDSWTREEFRMYVYNDGYAETDPEFSDIRPRRGAGEFLQEIESVNCELSVLDYGGGNGVFADVLRDGGIGSVDIYDPFIERFSARPQGNFNAITCMEVIEHIPHPMLAVHEIAKLLRPEGFVRVQTLEVPQVLTDEEIMRWWYLGPRNGHISMFSRRATQIAWGIVGMKVEFMSDHDYVAFRPDASYALKIYGKHYAT